MGYKNGILYNFLWTAHVQKMDTLLLGTCSYRECAVPACRSTAHVV